MKQSLKTEATRGMKFRQLADADFGSETIYTLKAPLIVLSGYEDSGYEQHMMKVTAERMANAAKIHTSKRASDVEVFLYLQSCTYLAPPGETMMRAIKYLCRKEFPEIADAVGFEVVKLHPGRYEDQQVLSLMQGLGERIYRSQMKHLKEGTQESIVQEALESP